MKLVVDRFEGDMIILEMDDCSTVSVPKKIIPNALEGDVIVITIDKQATNIAKSKITQLMADVFDE